MCKVGDLPEISRRIIIIAELDIIKKIIIWDLGNLSMVNVLKNFKDLLLNQHNLLWSVRWTVE